MVSSVCMLSVSQMRASTARAFTQVIAAGILSVQRADSEHPATAQEVASQQLLRTRRLRPGNGVSNDGRCPRDVLLEVAKRCAGHGSLAKLSQPRAGKGWATS